MSFFPGAPPNDNRADDSLSDVVRYEQTAPSESTGSPRSLLPSATPDHFQYQPQPHTFPPTTADDSNAMTWPADDGRGLGLYSFFSPIAIDYSSGALSLSHHFLPTPAYPTLHYPVMQLPDGQMCSFRKDSWMPEDDSKESWAVAQAAMAFLSDGECTTSPSSFGCSSADSVLSSPHSYTNERVFAQERELSPRIKIEYNPDCAMITRMPLDMDERESVQPTSVCPEQLQVTTYPDPTTESPCRTHECEDHKLALSADDFDSRPKRASPKPGSARFECEKCTQRFVRAFNLKAHLPTHDPSRQQSHTCSIEGCTKRFFRKTDLKRHQTSVHFKTKNHACRFCLRPFSRSDTLRRHIQDGCARRPECKTRAFRSQRSASVSMPPPPPMFFAQAANTML